jgi:hypothetical protein
MKNLITQKWILNAIQNCENSAEKDERRMPNPRTQTPRIEVILYHTRTGEWANEPSTVQRRASTVRQRTTTHNTARLHKAP